jgi:uncharacterized membrane protein YdjX (TVP38/TMEM64 family)
MKRLFAQRSGHMAVWRRAALLALLCGALAAVVTSEGLHAALLDVLAASSDIISRYPVRGALLFVLLAAVSAMLAFVSIAVVVPVAVYVWGEPFSMMLLWTGWVVGGIFSYAVARYFGRPFVRWLTTDAALDRVDRGIRPDTGFLRILLFQLALPSEVPGYVLGLARYPFHRFLFALAIAELPYTAATVYLGAGFVSARAGLLLAVGLCVAILSIGAFYLLRRS